MKYKKEKKERKKRGFQWEEGNVKVNYKQQIFELNVHLQWIHTYIYILVFWDQYYLINPIKDWKLDWKEEKAVNLPFSLLAFLNY